MATESNPTDETPPFICAQCGVRCWGVYIIGARTAALCGRHAAEAAEQYRREHPEPATPNVGVTHYGEPLTVEVEFGDAEELLGVIDALETVAYQYPAARRLLAALRASYEDATYQEPVRERSPYAAMSRQAARP